MAGKQSPTQRGIVGRVMREFKHGELESSSGAKVESPRQAIAIALHEAGASRDETPAGNKRDLSRSVAKGRQPEAGRDTRAALYEDAAKRGIPGRSRMTKAQLAQALGR